MERSYTPDPAIMLEMEPENGDGFVIIDHNGGVMQSGRDDDLPPTPPCNYHDVTDAAPLPGKPGYHHLEEKHKVGEERLRNSRSYCFFAAATAGCLGCLHDALESGIDVNAKSESLGYTALDFAFHAKRNAAALFLLQKGALLGQ